MLNRPSSEQADSLKYLLAGNPHHAKNLVAWLKGSRDELVSIMTNPSTGADHMFRNAGAVNVLTTLINEVTKHTD